MSFIPTNVDVNTSKKFESLSAERKQLQADGGLPEWYTTQAWQMFKSKYAVEGENAVNGRHRTIAKTLAAHMVGMEAEWERKFFDLMWGGILSPASPALANTGTTRGMPVSCSGQYVDDSIDSFYMNQHETAILSKYGFGTSADFSAIRSRGTAISTGGVANGAVEVMDDFFTTASKVSQGGSRRGSIGAYLDIEHADWDEAVDKLMVSPNGKNFGWIVRDSFCEKLQAGDPEANRRFEKMLYTKLVTGKGYLFFVDKANRHRPQMYKDLGLDIKASNLCSEIMLHSSSEYTYSCILSSLNLAHWETIKTTDAAFVATVFLDCLCSEFIDKSAGIAGLEKVRRFTEKGRAIGLGVMGFHTYLQGKMIAYGSLEAQWLSSEIAEHLHDESLRASQWLAETFGEPEWCKGYGVRNTHRTAYAPTKSSSILMGGVSESWFPEPGMVFTAGSAIGELNRITPVIYELMKERGVYSPATIQDIIDNLGSVQHVDWLTEEEKQVFLNAFELDQRIIFRHAMQRQKWVCQGQSMNFYVPEGGSETLIAQLISMCFQHPDCLSQYYIYSRSGVVVKDECISCSG